MADQDNEQGGQGRGDRGQGGEQTAQISGTVKISPQGGEQGQGSEGQGGGQKDSKDDTGDNKEDTPQRKSGKRFIIIAVVLLLVLGAVFFYWRSTFTENTDDAQVDGDIYQVSSRINGQVLHVYVTDNQQVQAGQLLADIDPRDYQVVLEQAKAQLAQARASYIQAGSNVPVIGTQLRSSVSTTSSDVLGSESAVSQAQRQLAAAQAQVDQAQANAVKAQLDVERYTPLVAKDVISKQQFDGAVAQAAASNAALLSAKATVSGQQDAIKQAQERLAQAKTNAAQAVKTGPDQMKIQQARATAAQADIEQAQARVDQAQLNLSYARITAPSAGIINKKNVDVGGNLAIGQDLLSIVPLTNLWVTANFKETQLKDMHQGQKVKMKVDAIGGKVFSGQVSQIGGATGSRLSLFPPENATGNYVKVVQRIPVRIDFTNLQEENKDLLLRPGYSVTPDVSIK